MKDSGKGMLNSEDFKQIAIKIGMAVIAGVITILVEQMRLVDFGQYATVATMAIFILQYIGQRLFQGK